MAASRRQATAAVARARHECNNENINKLSEATTESGNAGGRSPGDRQHQNPYDCYRSLRSSSPPQGGYDDRCRSSLIPPSRADGGKSVPGSQQPASSPLPQE
jgi:hypothetical protein